MLPGRNGISLRLFPPQEGRASFGCGSRRAAPGVSLVFGAVGMLDSLGAFLPGAHLDLIDRFALQKPETVPMLDPNTTRRRDVAKTNSGSSPYRVGDFA